MRRQEIRALAPSEAKALLEAVREDRLGPLFTVALATGARQGELFGLRWQDLDLDAGTMRIRQTVSRIDGRYQFGEPKTERSRRTIDLPAFATTALREQRRRQAEERLLAGRRWQDLALVFATTIGTPLDGAPVSDRLHELLAAAGLPRMRFHNLRHACASLLLAQGVPARVVMDVLGHSQIAVTLNTYSHVIPALKQDAAERLDRLFAVEA